jgi:hypothetical protein
MPDLSEEEWTAQKPHICFNYVSFSQAKLISFFVKSSKGLSTGYGS